MARSSQQLRSPTASAEKAFVNAQSLNIQAGAAAGIGVEFQASSYSLRSRLLPDLIGRFVQVVKEYPLPVITAISPYSRAVLSGMMQKFMNRPFFKI